MQESFDPYFEWLGIPKGKHPPNHYTLLGLKPTESDPEVIARAADVRLAKVRKVRPGGQLGDWGRLLDQLSAAKACLLDPAGKVAYDASLTLQAAVVPSTSTGIPAPAEPPPMPPPAAAVPQAEPAFVQAAAAEPLPAAATKKFGNRRLVAALVLLMALCGMFACVLLGQREQFARLDRSEMPQQTDCELPPPSSSSFVPAKPQAVLLPDRTRIAEPQAPAAVPEELIRPEIPPPAIAKPDPQPPPDPVPAPQPKPPVEQPPPQPDGTKQAALARALSKARFSMSKRDLPGARRHLATVAGGGAKTPAEEAEIARLQTMLDYLDEFWNGIRESLAKLESGSELVWKDRRVAVVEASANHLMIHDGKPYNWRINQIPTHILLAVAEQGFPKDAMSRVIVGTFLAVDRRGHRGLARQLWQQAAKAGENVEQLMPELDIDYGPSQ